MVFPSPLAPYVQMNSMDQPCKPFSRSAVVFPRGIPAARLEGGAGTASYVVLQVTSHY